MDVRCGWIIDFGVLCVDATLFFSIRDRVLLCRVPVAFAGAVSGYSGRSGSDPSQLLGAKALASVPSNLKVLS